MTNKTTETAAALTLEQFTRVCDQVDAELNEAMSGVFAQERTRVKATTYVETLCRDDVPVKTCWDMAQAAGFDTPHPFQSLMSSNTWDADLLWDVVTESASTSLECPDDDPLGPGIAVDETAQAKRGHHTAGVGVQYAGFAGKKVSCVTSVTLCLVTPGASTWVANELFLQEKEWFCGQGEKGAARRRSAGIPHDVEFASKPEIARRKLTELRAAGVKFTWAAGDEVYGRSSALRQDHEDHGEAYAYFVPRNFRVDLPDGTQVRADQTLELAQAQDSFEVRPCGDGLNGPRLYAWALIATASPEHFLVIRQPLDGDNPRPPAQNQDDTPDASGQRATPDPKTQNLPPGTGFMYCYVPKDSPIAPRFSNLLLMIGRRWPVEVTIGVGKGPIGWDQNQLRTYKSIQRHNALSGVAMLRANLIRQRAEQAPASLSAAGPDCAGIPSQPAQAPDPPVRDTPAIKEPPAVAQFPADDDEPEECLIPTGDAATPSFADEDCPPDIGCIRLSVAETLRLIGIARSQATRARKQALLRWSIWRRRHQAIARWHHRRARLATASPSP